MRNVPLRVDFAGGWLDVPKFAKPGDFIVNCTIEAFAVPPGSGLGGSARAAIVRGRDPFESELAIAGWQDAAVITETGLCAWRSGETPDLALKCNPDFLRGCMAVLWTGKPHDTASLVDCPRNYDLISLAARTAYSAAVSRSVSNLQMAIELTYRTQLLEGMDELPGEDEAKKYCGSGHGGYALYLFLDEHQRSAWLESMAGKHDVRPIEPYMRRVNDG